MAKKNDTKKKVNQETISEVAEKQINIFNELEATEYPTKNELSELNTGDSFKARATSGSDYIPLDNDIHKSMPVEMFEKLQRTPMRNNRILIQVRHKSSPLPDSISMIDLCYYDKVKRRIVNKHVIPLFYRDHYKGIYGREDMIFYCKRSDLKDIEIMLNRDKERLEVGNKEFNDFLSRVGGEIIEEEKDVNLNKTTDSDKLEIKEDVNVDDNVLDNLDKE